MAEVPEPCSDIGTFCRKKGKKYDSQKRWVSNLPRGGLR